IWISFNNDAAGRLEVCTMLPRRNSRCASVVKSRLNTVAESHTGGQFRRSRLTITPQNRSFSLSGFACLPIFNELQRKTGLSALWREKCSEKVRTNPVTPPPKEGTTMLVLTRKLGETIVIDNCITVTVAAIDGNKVRLGISA